MVNIKNPVQFDNEIQDAWRDNTKLDCALEILNSLSALNTTNAPAGLKERLLEIPEQSGWKVFSLSPIRATSLVLAPALALLVVLVVIPRQQHDRAQTYSKFDHQAVLSPIDSTELDGALNDLGALSADTGVNLDSNILDQDIQDLEEIL